MARYKIEKLLNDDYGEPRYAIFRTGNRYVIAFEDDYGVMFNNGYIEDLKDVYKKLKNKKLIKKTETPKQDWDDLMNLISFVIDKKGKYEVICGEDDLPIDFKRCFELSAMYDLEDIRQEEFQEEPNYVICADLISQFNFLVKRRF